MDKIVSCSLVLIVVGIVCALVPILHKRCKVNLPMVGALISGIGFSTLGIYGMYKLVLKLIEVFS